MDGNRLLELFADIADEVTDALAELTDWGETGARDRASNTQYRHDVVADELVVRRLLAEGLSVVSEESGRQGDGDLVVVVDPVDGSTNAGRGLPWYAISLCAVDDDGPLAGLVDNLALGERFQAVRGDGADAALAAGSSVLGGPSGVERMSDALVAFSGLPPEHGGWAQFRAYGAAALDLCAVAIGRFDAYVDLNAAHAPWDYLAAALICAEAGAVVGETAGRSLVTVDPGERRGPIVAASQGLLDELMDRYGRS